MLEEKTKMKQWMMPFLLLLVTMTSCATVDLKNADRLIERHPAGFQDAVRASTNSVEFVRDALKTINRLEAVIEREL
jgi:hypothetical protein